MTGFRNLEHDEIFREQTNSLIDLVSLNQNFTQWGTLFALKKRAFGAKNGTLTDFTYNSLISDKILDM